jgi:hypothetical protein
MEDIVDSEVTFTRDSLTTPRAAAVAGIVFSTLLILSLALWWSSLPADPKAAGPSLARSCRIAALALNLIPFAGIAFLWFIGVLRDRLGACEDRFFATVFFGSGLLFLAMLFTASAVADAMVILHGAANDKLTESGVYTFGRGVHYQIGDVYAVKMAGVFMISTCTLSIRTGIFPRWMAFLGYALALVLLLSVGYFRGITLVFPLWVLLISTHILMANLRPRPASDL